MRVTPPPLAVPRWTVHELAELVAVADLEPVSSPAYLRSCGLEAEQAWG